MHKKPTGGFDSRTHADSESMSTVVLICVYKKKKKLPLGKQGFVRSYELGISKMPVLLYHVDMKNKKIKHVILVFIQYQEYRINLVFKYIYQ